MTSAICDIATCPGRGEVMSLCFNPDHRNPLASIPNAGMSPANGADLVLRDEAAIDPPDFSGDPYFHRQRDGHGAKRRGKPRLYCSPECSRWVSDHYWSNDSGEGDVFTRKQRTWVPPGEGSTTRTFRRAAHKVTIALANGYFDCDLPCSLPGHVHRPWKPGDTVFYATIAPAADGDGSFEESIGRLYLTPEVSGYAPPLPVEAGDDGFVEAAPKVEDPTALANDQMSRISARVMELLPKPLVRFLISRAPMPPPAKAVAMVGAYAVAEQDPDVRDLYLDMVTTMPEYAEARATADELKALLGEAEK